MQEEELGRAIEDQIERLGFEFVELERGGSRNRPVVRVRIERPNAEPGQGVTLEDCTYVSRALQAFLDADGGLGERYVLEVSSPGVERPLIRRTDFERFAGRAVVLRGRPVVESGETRLEGTLEGIAGEAGSERIRLRLPDGRLVEVARDRIARAHLAFQWPGKRG